MRQLPFTTSILLALCAFAFAGPNRDAAVSIDYDRTTTQIDAVPALVKQGHAMSVAVRIRGVRDLDTYSFTITYDTASLSFTKAFASTGSEGAFLESQGGTIVGFFAREPRPGTIEVAVSLAGKDRKQAPDGDGVLGFVSFFGKLGNDVALKIDDIIILDSDQTEDRIANQ